MHGTPGIHGGHVRVLIVDDEPHLTELLSVAVTEAGRRPCPAADGESALRAGADDYVTKPFSLEEVVLRLRGLLRRAGAADGGPDGTVLALGDLVLAEETREVHRGGSPNLRRKMDRGRTPVIHTVRGLGYSIRAAEDAR